MLAPIAIKCLGELLKEKTEWNFAVNIMEVVALYVAKSKWDEASQMLVFMIVTPADRLLDRRAYAA